MRIKRMMKLNPSLMLTSILKKRSISAAKRRSVTKNTNDKELNELKDKFRTVEDINKLLENKSENAEDALFEMRKALNVLNEELNDTKEMHSKCHEKENHSEGSLQEEIHSKDKEVANALREELKTTKSDFDILLSQKNMAESKASIMDRKVIKLAWPTNENGKL
jgi:chromosome segregation ATPase